MKKCFLLILISLLISISVYSSGLEELANKAGEGIIKFFKIRKNSTFSISVLENSSTFNDIQVQKFYQLLISRVERDTETKFIDNLIGFSNNKSAFNSNRLTNIKYLISIKLINNRGNIGAGLTFFSRKFDRIEGIKYYESKISRGENLYIKHINYSFQTTGFIKQYEMNARLNFLDVNTIETISPEGNKSQLLTLFYTDRIVIFKLVNKSIKKLATKSIRWKRPFYFPHVFEGKSFIFTLNGRKLVAVGGNFLEESIIFEYNQKNSDLREIIRINMIPIKIVEINGSLNLIGIKYQPAQNFFNGSVYLMNISGGISANSRILQKSIKDFYSISILKSGELLRNIIIVDKNYNIRIYDSAMNSIYSSENKFGYAIGSLNDNWIITSSFVTKSDELKFFKVENLFSSPVYLNKTDYLIDSISEGKLLGKNGLWIKLINPEKEKNPVIQFWSKNIEKN